MLTWLRTLLLDKKLHEHFYITDSQGIFFFLAKNILGNVPFNGHIGDLYRQPAAPRPTSPLRMRYLMLG